MPNAPAPTYYKHGNLVAEWSVHCTYSPDRDEIVLTWRQAEGSYTAAKSGSATHGPGDLEDVVADLQRAVRILGARRLF